MLDSWTDQIRSSIDINSATILANALVHSKLDYCNSLYYSLPNSSIHRLQLVQNALARVVVPSTLRHHHITPVLKGLHWLPVEQRIKYKIASITYTNHFIISNHHIFINSFLLLPNLVVVYHPINYLIFNVSILYLVYDPSSLQLQKFGIIYLPHFVYLLLIVHSVPNLKLFSFHYSLIFLYGSNIWIIDWLVF